MAAVSVVTSVVLAVGGAAAAANTPGSPPLTLQSSVPTLDQCPYVKSHLSTYAAAGRRYVGCLTTGPAARGQSKAAPGAPSQCTMNADLVYTRFASCFEVGWTYTITNTQTGAIEGYGSGTTTFWNALSSTNRTTWNENGNLNINTFSGLAIGTTILAPFDCQNQCGVTSNATSWAPQTSFVPANDNANYAGAQSYGSPGTSTIYLNFQIDMTFENPSVAPSFLTIGPTNGVGTMRCDSISYLNSSGCSYNQYPTFFTLSLSDPKVGQAAAVDQRGQQTLSTHPGLYGQGSTLTRDASQADINANRALACKGVPPSCDEYPYASTHQGAAFGPYVTGSISASQNSTEGARLGGFYKKNRIADGDPFYVNVTP